MSSSTSGKFSSQDSVVVVMGPTGAGKSTFINYATGQDGKTVGHSWRSETSEVRSVRTTHPVGGHPIVFVDTPGFDDTFKSDMEILATIADWLMRTYKSKVNLSTILYLHRISDNRMSGSAMKNLKLFWKLCGRKVMPNVVIVTTMWSLVQADWGKDREEVLTKEVWKDMVDNGCTVKRFQDTRESAWAIIGNDVENSRGTRLAREMVDSQRGLNETKAGITLNKALEKLMREQQDITRKLQERMKNHQDNEPVVEGLTAQMTDVEKKIEQTTAQIRQLRIPLMRKFALRFMRAQE